jgi:hypothetical protein
MAAKARSSQRFGVLAGLALAAFGTLLAFALAAPPASAQSGGFFGQSGGSMFESLFGPFSGPRRVPSERQADFTRAPPPRKVDSPPTSNVMVLGDSMADWLAFGLEEALADTPEIGVVRKHRAGSGLIRYDARNEAQDWAQAAREAIAASKPQFIVMMIGLHDRQAIRARPLPTGAASVTGESPPPLATVPQPGAAAAGPGASRDQPSIAAAEPSSQARGGLQLFEFRTEPWAEHYVRRIDAVIAALKSAGVPVFWVGLPAIRGPKSTSEMLYLNDLYRTRAEKAGIPYIDVWDGFVDEHGRYMVQGPDFEGQTRRLRVSDGVHFTKAGARKLAHYVEREMRRVMTRGIGPIALPASEPVPAPAAQPGMPTARPLSGPVLPLTGSATAGQELAGEGDGAAVRRQAVATRVLVNGESLKPPAGRSDDFQWPRRAIAPFGKDPAVATTTDPLPVMQPTPAATVTAPSGDTRAVASGTSRRTTGRSSQSRRNARQGPSLPFFR